MFILIKNYIAQINKKKTLIFLLLFSFLAVGLNTEIKKILLIGDSTSLIYSVYLKKYTNNKFVIRHKGNAAEALVGLDNPRGANAGDSRMILDYFKHFHEKEINIKDDIILLNCGLHDIKTDIKTNQKQVSLAEYCQNLNSIYSIINNLGYKLVWINTTPVIDSIHNTSNVGFYRYNKDVIEYNTCVDSLFTKKNVPIIDLYSFSKSFPRDAYKDHVHFQPKYAELQAAFISNFLMKLNL